MSLPNKPITRKEQYLAKAAGQAVTIPDEPITREEAYLDKIARGGGGGGGTTDYADLDNKPSINGVELSGNKTSSDLHIEGGGSSELTDDITTAVDVGGISAGTTYAEGTSLETILSDMLSPTLYPAFVAPSATLAGTGDKLLEVGATASVTLTANFNRGSINPAYGTSGYRSGVATEYSLNGGTGQAGNTWSETVTGSNKTFTASVSYEAGEQPKDSKGNDYQSPLPAGSVTTSAVNYAFAYTMWANTSSIGTVAKLSLINNASTKQRDMVFPAQTVANPEVFDIPASWNVTAVQVKNDLNNQFEDASSQFSVTDVTHDDAGGTSVNYKRYTFNMGIATGARTVRVKWS